MTRMQSSYTLRSITTRTTLPGWAAQLAGNKLGATAASTPSVSQDIWIAYALHVESESTKKR